MIKQLFENTTALGIKTTQAVNHIYHLSLSLAIVLENIEIVKCLLNHAKNLDIDVSKLLKSEDNTITSQESKQRAIILHNILKSPNSKMLDLLLKTLAELENGNEAISTIIDKPLSSSHTKEKLVLALSYIKSEDQKSFIAHCADILKNYKLIALDKVFVTTHPMKIEDDSVKNSIISSAYKISVLRDQVGDSLFSKEGNFDEKWLKSGELTKLSLVKKDLMEYIEPKENNSNSLNGETKKNDWNNLKTNLKTTVLSFLIAPKEVKPESIKAVLTVLRQPLHNALEEQEIKAGTYNKSLALLRKAAFEKVGATPDKEPPPPAPELNKYLLNKELGIMEVSNALKPKIVALSDASQEQNISAINSEAEFAKQNTAYVPSSIQKALYNASIGFKMLDSAVDSARFIHEPTANNATKVIVDSAHIYSMLAGFNLYSAVISAAEIIYLGSIGEYGKVLQNAVITTAYMALPYAVAYGAPQLALWYNALTAGCSAYNALSNSYSLYKEYMQDDWSLKSYAAYADLGWFWHNLLDQSGNDLDVELAAYAENDWQNDLYQSGNDLHVEL